ncbi:MAG: hypothetical protein QM736_14150 [Vicinamibacterales bacterium]
MVKPTNGAMQAVSMIAGAALWTFLELTVGDPFDTALYPLTLVVLGIVLAALNPERGWRWAVGAVLGEAAALLVSVATVRGGPLWPVGLLYVVAYGLLIWAGTSTALLFRSVTARRSEK